MGTADHVLADSGERGAAYVPPPLPHLGELVASMNVIRALVGETFAELSGFAENTSVKLSSFNSMMDPYVRYFFPAGDAGADTFLGEVVGPGRDEMLSAVDRAVSIMEGDEIIYESIEDSVASTMTLRDGIDGIISIIDEIEIYFLNTMIVSIKAGPGGEALTMISREMGNLTSATNALSARFKNLIGNLDVERETFRGVRERIAVIQENRLTRMSLAVRTVFRDMIEQLARLSREVRAVMETGRGIESFARALLSRLQMDDLYAQNIDKIIFLVEAFRAREAEGGGLRDDVFAGMVRDKLRALWEELRSHDDDMRGIVLLCDELAGGVLPVLSEARSHGSGSGSDLDVIYSRIEGMRAEFLESIDMIVAHKRRIMVVAEKVRDIVADFGDFFADIAQIGKKLEVINMLTRIELARSSHLAGLLGGSLAQVSALPGEIKRRAAESEAVYRAVRAGVEANLAACREAIDCQERNLDEVARSIKRVSVKLYESRKYFLDVMGEIGASAGAVVKYVGGCEADRLKLESTMSSLRGLDGVMTALDAPAMAERSDELHALEADLTRDMADGDYRKSLVHSFFLEYLDGKDPADVTFF